MIRKFALLVMISALIFLSAHLFFKDTLLVGNAVVALCDDSDLIEKNDPVAGTVFNREQFMSINYAVSGITEGIHPTLKLHTTRRDTCPSSSKIREFYCDVKKNTIAWAEEKCPPRSKCYDGACIPLFCKDPDGFNTTKSSTVRYNSAEGVKELTARDYCDSDSVLVEYVCQKQDLTKSGNIINIYDLPKDLRRSVYFKCQAGSKCKSGACVST